MAVARANIPGVTGAPRGGAKKALHAFLVPDPVGGSVCGDVGQRAPAVGGLSARTARRGVEPRGSGTNMGAPKNYRSFDEFQREEIRPDQKLGWSIDDLWKDAELRMASSEFEEREPDELDFG
jgi:hypothetical protein